MGEFQQRRGLEDKRKPGEQIKRKLFDNVIIKSNRLYVNFKRCKEMREKRMSRKKGREGGRKKGREKEDLYLSFLMFYHQSILMCSVLLGSFWSPNSVPLCPDCTDFLVPSLSKSPFHTTFVIIIDLLGFSVCLLACLLRSILFLNCMYAGVSVFIHVHSGTHESHSGVGSPSWSYS